MRRAVEDDASLTLESWAGERRITSWRERREEEGQTREHRGVAATSSELLDYSNLFDLIAMCDTATNWSRVAEGLGKRKEVVSLLERLNDVRNAVAHGRPLVPFEVDLAAGIAGDIRNRVTIFMSSLDPVGEYYPRIESVTDEFGHATDAAETLRTSTAVCITGTTLDVEDRVRFTCSGSDPQGRLLLWQLANGRQPLPYSTAEGDDAILEWVVDHGDVGQQTGVFVELHCQGTRYHRWGSWDGRILFTYTVRPPRDN